MNAKLTHYGLLFLSIQLIVLFAVLSVDPSTAISSAPVTVLTQHNNNSRTGANLNETILNTSNVNVSQFGKLFTRAVDGHTYAQPLYVPNLVIPGKGIHNVVFVATQHNSVYAFDADDPSTGTPLWHTNLGNSVPIPNDDIGPAGFQDIQVEIGVTGTPVIDPATNTIYVLALTNETSAICTSDCSYAHRLHALDITTGAEKFGGPVLIAGSVTGAPLQTMAPIRVSQKPNHPVGAGPSRQTDLITFDSQQELQRPGLLLSNGIVYIAFGSYGDAVPYYGWVFGYDAQTLQQASIFNTTPNGTMGAIWQGGQGLAADAAGNIYGVTGNGTYSDTLKNYGDSFIKLDPSAVVSGVLPVVDWFTPYNQDYLATWDLDLGSTGPLLIPETNLALGGGKQGTLYLLDRDNMGRYNGPSGPDNIVQSSSVITHGIFGSPVYWKSQQGSFVYAWGSNDLLRAFSFNSNLLQITPQAVGSTYATFPGGILALSADGNNTGTGILWASHGIGQAYHSIVSGILLAYNASNINTKLWDSTQNSSRDDVGYFVKFNPPTVANGKVYLGTSSNQLDVYGLLAPSIAIQPAGQTVAHDTSATLTVIASGQSSLHYQWYRGNTHDSSNPLGADSSSFVTPPITIPTSFWVRVSNTIGNVDSNAAFITTPLFYYFPQIGK